MNSDDFRGPGFKSGYDPVWMDLLAHHAEAPFHALVGGGDQLYCDSIIREPELQDWVTQTKPEAKRNYPLTEEMRLAIDRFYFNHYCQSFRSGAFARANSTMCASLWSCGMLRCARALTLTVQTDAEHAGCAPPVSVITNNTDSPAVVDDHGEPRCVVRKRRRPHASHVQTW